MINGSGTPPLPSLTSPGLAGSQYARIERVSGVARKLPTGRHAKAIMRRFADIHCPLCRMGSRIMIIDGCKATGRIDGFGKAAKGNAAPGAAPLCQSVSG
jgi:hypothetical protein